MGSRGTRERGHQITEEVSQKLRKMITPTLENRNANQNIFNFSDESGRENGSASEEGVRWWECSPRGPSPLESPREHSRGPGCGHTDQPRPRQGLSAWGGGHCKAAWTWPHQPPSGGPCGRAGVFPTLFHLPHQWFALPRRREQGDGGRAGSAQSMAGGPPGRTDPWGGEWARPTSLFKQNRPDAAGPLPGLKPCSAPGQGSGGHAGDRKSTRLNSSH